MSQLCRVALVYFDPPFRQSSTLHSKEQKSGVTDRIQNDREPGPAKLQPFEGTWPLTGKIPCILPTALDTQKPREMVYISV